jgi:DNA-3-methyladenine glycosylase I
MIAYHDTEWGVPVHDDRIHFEFLTLEGAQAGLSWETILKKRQSYRDAFAEFDPARVARFTPARVERLLQNPGIVRNRLKVTSTIQNAKAFRTIQREFGSFDTYIWDFVGGVPRINRWAALREIPPRTAESDAMSRDLLHRGFKFVGSTICYAFMQAVGLVNDHTVDCFRYSTALTLTLLLSAAIPRYAVAQTGVFSGVVQDSATLAPLPGLRVSLLDGKRQLLGSTVTDDRGLFAIPHSDGGIFQLRFDRPGVKSMFGPVDTVSADSVVSRSYKVSFAVPSWDSVFAEYQVDQPVEPLPGFQDPPRYPRSLQRLSIDGTVKLSFVVDTSGHVDMKSVRIIRSSDAAFFKAVMDWLPHTRYIPARFRGRKVRERVDQTFHFTAPLAR